MNKRDDITMYFSVINMPKRKYFEKLCSSYKIDILGELNTFLERHKSPKLTQEMGSLNNLMY